MKTRKGSSLFDRSAYDEFIYNLSDYNQKKFYEIVCNIEDYFNLNPLKSMIKISIEEKDRYIYEAINDKILYRKSSLKNNDKYFFIKQDSDEYQYYLTKFKNKLEKYLKIKNVHCELDNNAFYLILPDGEKRAMVFEERDQNKLYMLKVFTALFEHWFIKGNSPLQSKIMRSRVIEQGVPDDEANNESFIYHQIRNIRKKIESSLLQDYIKIDYDKKNRAYNLIINPYPKSPNTV